MPRYKDADKMIEFINTHLPYSASPDFMDGVNDCIRMIDDKNAIPTADVKEVVYGEWKYNRTVSGLACVVCSSCGHEAFATAKYVTDGIGCPFCLTNMKKESNI